MGTCYQTWLEVISELKWKDLLHTFLNMWKNISILTLMVIVTTAHQLMPFEPFQHYLKKSDANLETRMLKEDSKYRLGSETKPSLYDIKLKFNISGPPTFDGDVEITFQALKGGLTSVVLNAENIDIIKDSVRITLNNGANMYHNHTYDETYQKITFNTKSALNANVNYVIKIQYTGHMKEDLKGVYLSEYDQGTAKKKLITTHFGQFARRMMPCWDEPQFKAQFKFTITRDANMKAFSNAAIEKPGATVDVFKPTSVISPYALALVIADFVLQENKNEKFGVFARPNASDDTAYALSVGPKLIKAFDDWTDMPYHKMAGVDKMELGAIPDFSAVSSFVLCLFYVICKQCFVLGSNGELGFDFAQRSHVVVQQRLCEHSTKAVDSYGDFTRVGPHVVWGSCHVQLVR